MINLKSPLTNKRYFDIFMYSIRIGTFTKAIDQRAIDDNNETDRCIEILNWMPEVDMHINTLQEMKDNGMRRILK